ncbi:MAG: YkgJ family cysteine cluster protein [Candidatus Electrothrix sp. AU1_5]|nr:YkgJ family cysteine cluster protein [Candidatus Electrothrix gigas]
MTCNHLHYHNEFSYFFNSDRCASCGGKCCRGQQGYIWLSMKELEKMAQARNTSPEAFAREYVRQVKGKMSLKERIINNEHFCCFLDPVDHCCTVYPYRPEQCRTFPFWEQYKEESKELFQLCPGVSLL